MSLRCLSVYSQSNVRNVVLSGTAAPDRKLQIRDIPSVQFPIPAATELDRPVGPHEVAFPESFLSKHFGWGDRIAKTCDGSEKPGLRWFFLVAVISNFGVSQFGHFGTGAPSSKAVAYIKN